MSFPDGWQPTEKNQVIGESYSDGAFIKAVAAAHGVPDFDFTAPQGEDGRPVGKGGFKTHLLGMQNFIKRGKVSRVVVVGDNDDNHATAAAAVQRAIGETYGYPKPTAPCQMSFSGSLGVGFLMLPGSGQNGCLETLLLKATMHGALTNNCLSSWITCSGFPTVRQNDYDKFKIRSLLAASIQDDPNITLRRIWTKQSNPIRANDPAFTWIATFLTTAFS